jgi:hypothetical protein
VRQGAHGGTAVFQYDAQGKLLAAPDCYRCDAGGGGGGACSGAPPPSPMGHAAKPPLASPQRYYCQQQQQQLEYEYEYEQQHPPQHHHHHQSSPTRAAPAATAFQQQLHSPLHSGASGYRAQSSPLSAYLTASSPQACTGRAAVAGSAGDALAEVHVWLQPPPQMRQLPSAGSPHAARQPPAR